MPLEPFFKDNSLLQSRFAEIEGCPVLPEHEAQFLVAQEAVETVQGAGNLGVKIPWRQAVGVCPFLGNGPLGQALREFGADTFVCEIKEEFRLK